MPRFETNSPNWKFSIVGVSGNKVASVSFNEASQSTEIEMKPGATYAATNGGIGFEIDKPSNIPVKGTVAEVKGKLGL